MVEVFKLIKNICDDYSYIAYSGPISYIGILSKKKEKCKDKIISDFIIRIIKILTKFEENRQGDKSEKIYQNLQKKLAEEFEKIEKELGEYYLEFLEEKTNLEENV